MPNIEGESLFEPRIPHSRNPFRRLSYHALMQVTEIFERIKRDESGDKELPDPKGLVGHVEQMLGLKKEKTP